MGDLNWGGIFIALFTVVGTAVSAFIGLLVARTNRDSNTAGKRIDASAAELGDLRDLVGSLSQENRAQRGELNQARAEMQTWQEKASEERRMLGTQIIKVQQELLDTNRNVKRQTEMLFAIDQAAREMFPQEWTKILAAVLPTHREAYLLVVPAPEPPDPALPPEPDPATDPQS